AATRCLASTMLALFEGATHCRTASRWSMDVKAASSDWTRVTPSLNDFASLSNWVLAAVGSAGLARSVKACVKTASTLPWWEATVFRVWLALEGCPEASAGLARISRGSARVLGWLGIGLGRIIRRAVALGRLLPLRIAGWRIGRLRWRQRISAIRAGLCARLVPGHAAIRARWRLVGLHSCAAALPMQLGAGREPFGETPTLPSPASRGGK